MTVDLGTVSVTLNHAATDVERGGPAFKMVATKVSTSVYNWSSEIKGSSSLTLQAAYYNNKFNVWEYVLEPLEGQNQHFSYWTVTAEVQCCSGCSLYLLPVYLLPVYLLPVYLLPVYLLPPLPP